MPQLTRKLLLDTVHTALAGQPWVNALWEDGSAAFARDDQWSDVDLQAGLEDSHVAETFAVVEAALGKVAKTELIFAVPEPAWHGHSQRFYRFADAPPWLILDFCVIRQGNPHKLIEPNSTAPPACSSISPGCFASRQRSTAPPWKPNCRPGSPSSRCASRCSKCA